MHYFVYEFIWIYICFRGLIEIDYNNWNQIIFFKSATLLVGTLQPFLKTNNGIKFILTLFRLILTFPKYVLQGLL